MESASSYLAYFGIGLIALYLFLFVRTNNILSKEEKGRLIREAGSYRHWYLCIPLIVAVFFIDVLIVKLVLSLIILPIALLEDRAHNKRVRSLSFDPRYCNRNARLSWLSFAGLLCILSSEVLGTAVS